MNKAVKALLGLIFIGLVAAGGSLAFVQFNNAPEEWVEDQSLLIEPGMSVSTIGYRLEALGVIRSYYLFRAIHELEGRGNTVPTGSYTLEAGLSTRQIYAKLVSGRQDMISVTIPEGWTSSAIAARLEEYGICSAADFLNQLEDESLISSYGLSVDHLEGFLFPDTYQFVYNESAENVIRGLVDNFFVNLSRVYPDWTDLTADQLNRKIVMASIVEKEYRLAQEAPLIASVFYNRLNSNEFTHLQSCATVIYVITEIQGKSHPSRLLYRDLEIESPYNTYWAPGLPPAPIANPGYTALEAAFNPADTDYIFFVVKDARVGSHNFSNNYGEFLINKDSYLESFRSK